jgi:Protein of unknown function, DUF255
VNRLQLTIAVWALLAAWLGCERFTRRANVIPTAEALRAAALREAKQQDKRVLLWFVDSNNIWSDLLATYHADSEVAQVLGKYIVPVKIHVRDTPGGEQLYLETGSIRGAPAFTILDSNGALLADSGSDEEHNIGFPTTPHELDAYCLALQTACPHITLPELGLLREKLQAVRQAHEPQP